MAELVSSPDQVAKNIRRLHHYSKGGEVERAFHRQTIKNGKVFVHLVEGEGSLFAPSKFAGYVDNNYKVSRSKGRDGRTTNPRLSAMFGRHIGEADKGYAEIEELYLQYCANFKIDPSYYPGRPRRYWSFNLYANDSVVKGVKSDRSKHGKKWTDFELRAAVNAYFQMLELENENVHYSKTQYRKELLAGPLRGRKSLDHRMQNISHILQEQNEKWLKGFKPLANVGNESRERLTKIVAERIMAAGQLQPAKAPPLREGRALPPTGYWMFVCRRGRWDGNAWLRSGSSETLYMVTEAHRNEVQVGDLGVLRLNKLAGTRKRKPQPAGAYAILEVVEAPEMRESDHEFEFSDPKEASILKWRAKVRVLTNIVDRPVDALSLPSDGEFRHIRFPLPQSTIPISSTVFHEIVKQSGVSLTELQQLRETSTTDGVRRLERKAVSLDPKKRERISSAIERGIIGSQVKAARGHRCQLCEALGRQPVAFVKKGGLGYSEAHHVQPVSLMLAGSLADVNIMVLCPNHHRQAHYGNFAIKDYRQNEWLIEIDDKSLTIPRTRIPT